jgi:bacteriorhodopsin
MGLIIRTNDALEVNPQYLQSTFGLNTHGSDWLWAVCAFYCLALLAVIGLTFSARQGEKIFHYLFTISLFTGAIAYFSMASDLASVPVLASLSQSGTRQIFYARYVNWLARLLDSFTLPSSWILELTRNNRFVAWAPMLMAVGLVSGVSWATIIYNIALAWIWITAYLCSALTETRYKWGFFVFGTIAMFLLTCSLFVNGHKTSVRLGDPIKKHYMAICGYLTLFMFCYPIAFGVDDGGNKITVTQGFVFWGILDLFTIPIFEVCLLMLAAKWDFKLLNVYFTQYGRVARGADVTEREKEQHTAAQV